MESMRNLINIFEQNRLPAPMEPTFKKDSGGNLVPDIDYRLNPEMQPKPRDQDLPKLPAPMEPTFKKDSRGNLVPDIDYQLNPEMRPRPGQSNVTPTPTVPSAPATVPKSGQPSKPNTRIPTVPPAGQGVKKVTEHEFHDSVADIIEEIKQLSNTTKNYQEQDLAEGHADQQRKIFKQNGKPVGEVGIDRESSPGVGQWYMKCYAYDIDNSGYDSYEEAVAELKHCLKQGVAEGYTGRETKDGTWRVFKDGKAVAVAGPFKSREEAAAWIKKQKPDVAEGVYQ